MHEPGDKIEQIIHRIWELVDPVARSEGVELIEVEFRRESHGWVLRLYIDREDGISVDDCAQLSHTLSDLLDVADPIDFPYHLEVSSPGLNRPLRKREHFSKFLGHVIEVRTLAPINNRRNFKGILEKVESDTLQVNCDSAVHEIPLGQLDRARLKYFESQALGRS